jgi:hypothetical protein
MLLALLFAPPAQVAIFFAAFLAVPAAFLTTFLVLAAAFVTADPVAFAVFFAAEPSFLAAVLTPLPTFSAAFLIFLNRPACACGCPTLPRRSIVGPAAVKANASISVMDFNVSHSWGWVSGGPCAANTRQSRRSGKRFCIAQNFSRRVPGG